MPFAEPETALASRITTGKVVEGRREKNSASCRPLDAFYDISITYTKTQQLTQSGLLRGTENRGLNLGLKGRGFLAAPSVGEMKLAF
jgi:hypothetical protein